MKKTEESLFRKSGVPIVELWIAKGTVRENLQKTTKLNDAIFAYKNLPRDTEEEILAAEKWLELSKNISQLKNFVIMVFTSDRMRKKLADKTIDKWLELSKTHKDVWYATQIKSYRQKKDKQEKIITAMIRVTKSFPTAVWLYGYCKNTSKNQELLSSVIMKVIETSSNINEAKIALDMACLGKEQKAAVEKILKLSK